MIITRVEKHIIKPSNEHYKLLDEFCFKSKNLYNFVNYHVRKQFIEDGTWLRYNDMDKLFKQDGMDKDYRAMPLAQSSQQCLRLLDNNWKSFFKSIKDYNKNPNKYSGRPKLPKYLSKEGRNLLVLTNNNKSNINEGIIEFPKCFKGLQLNTKTDNWQQIRILPRNKHIVIEVIYKKEVQEKQKDNGKYLSIDIGIDNFATITNNIGLKPVVINGKGLKSINKYYNKQLSHYRCIAKRLNNLDYTKRMNQLTIKRNNIVSDFMHKASKYIIAYALDNNISKIVVGNNKDWKRESKMSKQVNQSFVGIPHQDFTNKLIYKGENVGIEVILTEESYTSGTSFLDNELPIKENYNKSRRKYRGLFVSNKGIKINADVNGSYQIMRKVFPETFVDGILDVGLHPVRVDI